MNKKYDCVVVTREYTDNQGQKKKVYQNVGSVIQGDNGPFILLDRTFNAAGLPNPDNRSNCIISLFEPKPRDGAQQAPAQGGQGFDDSIPF